jgi:hypothetical protein
MEILKVKSVTTNVMEVIETKCGKQFILNQHYSNDGSELLYSVFALEDAIIGADVTDDPEVDEMMGMYFSIKHELENGISSDEDMYEDYDPFK